MWQEIIIGVLVAASVFYLGRRIFKTTVKGEGGGCADCPPAERGKHNRK
ncbi:MAG TPA: FeoB-associated Cys-rich membrane protein [Bacteroidia bacterium]|nr:FeoB-associated Cys-rich membrane protein [Bacteroidia bacterium]